MEEKIVTLLDEIVGLLGDMSKTQGTIISILDKLVQNQTMILDQLPEEEIIEFVKKDAFCNGCESVR